MPPSERRLCRYGARGGRAGRRIAAGPLTQGGLIRLCKEGHWFQDLSPTRVASDPETILALSMSAKMISGSSEGPLYRLGFWEKEIRESAAHFFPIQNLSPSVCLQLWHLAPDLTQVVCKECILAIQKSPFWITRFVCLLFG